MYVLFYDSEYACYTIINIKFKKGRYLSPDIVDISLKIITHYYF